MSDIRIEYSNYIRNSYWESTNDISGLEALVKLIKHKSYLTSLESKLVDDLNFYNIKYESN